jgi:hypothetical protein
VEKGIVEKVRGEKLEKRIERREPRGENREARAGRELRLRK